MAPLGIEDEGVFDVSDHPYSAANCVELAEESAEYETTLHWHLLARALHRGTDGRPALPLEVILAIFRAADIIVPDPSLTVLASRSLNLLCENERTDALETWFTTSPLTQATLSRLAGIQLHTLSYDPRVPEGNDDPFSFTWYSIFIQRESGVPLDDRDRESWGWESHRNHLGGDNPVYLRGPLLGHNHPLLQELREGDILAVVAFAPFKGVHNIALRGHLRFWTYFEPVVL
ncbi:hypothetical protein AURDEDRAFT_159545 [Auricularia subglabra TFB-10046 SS5]|nr:hypothetical protein AURDEDRAFT_159545 [Auricularia subglabra TFB-10046 SS5]